MLGSVYISNILTNKLEKYNIIPAKYSRHYQFCFEYIFENVLFMLSLLTVSFLIREPIAGLIFISILLPMRSFCGGFHASSKNKCTLLSYIFFVVYLISVISINKIKPTSFLMLFLYFFGIILLCIISPIDTPAKRFNNTQKEKMKRLCLIYSIIITLIYLISYIYSITYICNSICICINMILITIIFTKLTKPLQADKEVLL